MPNTQMRDLAIGLMRSNYRAADNLAKEFCKSRDALIRCAMESHLASAERWRVKAREHGAKV